jgi:metal-dependent hydrolase (beta-lactamase superfamily II)
VTKNIDEFKSGIKPDESFMSPDFGITVLGCSHGFDPKGSTSGFILWINGKGIMVDPPPFSQTYLQEFGISSQSISSIIITHCHADHDAGAFHKILDNQRVEIITTRTIMNSFLRKYSALSDIPINELKQYFIFRPVVIGT